MAARINKKINSDQISVIINRCLADKHTVLECDDCLSVRSAGTRKTNVP